jgi:antirestriction protein ArdC
VRALFARCANPSVDEIRVPPQALEEYESAALWYAERDHELAERFVQAVEDAIPTDS